MKAKGKLKLVFPTKEYKEQIEEYLKEHFDNGEFDLAGDGGLDKIKNFDEWLLKISKNLSEKTIEENKVPSTIFLGVRKSDNKVIGTIQIRHKLNEKLLKNIGHIGDGVRPSERRKGYATEMIRLALEECKKLGIDRVLMVCYKDNIASRKSIINNGGILENEIQSEDGKIDQRYWISLKKRYANRFTKEEVKKLDLKTITVKEKIFIGDIYFYNLIDVPNKITIPNGKSIIDNNYKWLEFYDYSSKVKLTAIYDENDKIVEWYFDIAREIGKENGIPYEDDLYLDVVVTPTGEIILLDEDELKEALNRMEITKEEYKNTYKEAEKLMARLTGKKDKLQEFTDKYLKLMQENLTESEDLTINNNAPLNIKENINPELVKYIEDEIFPLYQRNEEGHGIKHIKTVIKRSLKFATQHNANLDMSYTIAAYHDIGHYIDRKRHEIISAEIFMEDEKIKKWFTDEQREIIKEAIEDHRASSDHKPRSIYGMIVSTADRTIIDIDNTIKRSYSYGKRNYAGLSEEEQIERIYQHLSEKYGENGYAKVYLEDKEFDEAIKELRQALSNKEEFIERVKKVINQ